MRVLRLIYRNMFVLVLLITVWLSVPTSLLINDASSSFEFREQIFSRTLPFGTVHRARWRAEVTLLDNSKECRSDWRESTFQAGTNAVTFTVDPWAWPCIDLGKDFSYMSIRQAYVLGFPLRASSTVDIVRVK